MTVLQRTWEYGTKTKVKVLDIVKTYSGLAVITCIGESATHDGRVTVQQGYVIVDRKYPENLETGIETEIIFSRGGPFGGCWRFADI